MFAASEARRERSLDDFRDAVDAFDEALERVLPLSHRAHVLDELSRATEEWESSPDDEDVRERYEAAVAACDGIERHLCTPETLRDHSSQMAVLTDRFGNLFDAFKQTASEGTDLVPVRELFQAECRLYELSVAGFASYTLRARISAAVGHRDALREAVDRLIRHGSPQADTQSVLASNEALLASDKAYYDGFEESAELASLKADGYATVLQEAKDWHSKLEHTSPRTTKEINRYVLRDAASALLGIAVYTALCVWLIGIAPKVAVVLFWLGAAAATLRAIQVAIIWTTGTLLLLAKLGGLKPAEEANTLIASVLRTAEFAVALFAMYAIFRRLYPFGHFLWLF